MEKFEKRDKVALGGLTFKKGMRIWTVTITVYKNNRRKINNFHFADSDSAKAFWDDRWQDFENTTPGFTVRKNEYSENRFGDVIKANRTYVINDNEYDRTVFFMKQVRVLELDNTSTIDEDDTNEPDYDEAYDDNEPEEYI